MKALYIHTVRRDTVTSGWNNNCWCSKGEKKNNNTRVLWLCSDVILVLHPFCEGWIFLRSDLGSFPTSPCRDRWRSGGGSLRTAFSGAGRKWHGWAKPQQVMSFNYWQRSLITFLLFTTSWTYSSFSCSCLFCLPDSVCRVLWECSSIARVKWS